MINVPTPRLYTERLVLRAPGAQDWEAFATFLADDRAVFIGGPINRTKAWRAFGHAIGHWVLRGYGSFIITVKGSDDAIGMTGPWFPEGWPEQELGWTLWDIQHEGKGYAFEAACAARDYAFRDLGWQTAVSYIDPLNIRSIALAQQMGCEIDPAAANPDGDDTLVYRHPKPEGMA